MGSTENASCAGSGIDSAEENHSSEVLSRYSALEGVIDTVSRRYAMQIIGLLAAHGPMRYTTLADALDVTSTSTFVSQLKELTEADYIRRQSHNEVPPRVEYSLTPEGRELDERLQPLLEWAAEH